MTQPTDTQVRYEVLDVLRGFALAGILLINATSIFAVKGSTPGFFVQIPAADRVLQDAILFFIESKFFTLFSLLFGIGFAIQMQSANRQGAAFIPRIVRRMLTLLGFGVLHVALLWDGDILIIYGLVGLVLITLRNRSAARLRRAVLWLLGVPAALITLVVLASLAVRLDPNIGHSLANIDRQIVSGFESEFLDSRLAHETYLSAVPHRITGYLSTFPLLFSRVPTVLAMFCLGLVIGRSQILANLSDYQPLLRRTRRLGLGLGFGAMAVILLCLKLMPTTSAFAVLFLDQYLAGPVLALGYAATIALWIDEGRTPGVAKSLAVTGKMALTNYLTQSLYVTAIAYGWGLGWYGTVDGFQVLAICVLVFATQMFLSRLWLSRFEYGPLEWIWRCATYWRLVPLKRRS